jgi:hypothetical protein
MTTMQKSQCISKYIKYQSPSIISSKYSPSYLKSFDSRLKERDLLPSIESTRVSQSRLKSKSPQKVPFSRTVPSKSEKPSEKIDLEVTGTCKVYTHLDSRLSKIQENLNQRKKSISIQEDERKERYYINYKAKLKQIAQLRDLKSKNRVKSICKARCVSDHSKYVETSEVCLQTPANFNN